MQGLKGKIYLYAKPTLRVDPYFHVFSSIQIIIAKSCHLNSSSKSCKQVIKYNNYIINHHQCHQVIYMLTDIRQAVTHI
jgi:hypothetical protein